MSIRLLRACSSERQSTQGSPIASAWSAAALDARILGLAAFVSSSLSLCHRKRDLVLKEKGPHLRTAVQGKSPFSLRKAFDTASSEKKSTSLSDSPEAVWQDAEYRNKLTLSVHLEAVLMLSQGVLTMSVCLFVYFFK